MFCTNCGNKLELNTKFCGGCGSKVNETTNNILDGGQTELDRLMNTYIKSYAEAYGGNPSSPKMYVREHDILSGRRGLFIILPTLVTFIFLGAFAFFAIAIGLLLYVLSCGRVVNKESLKVCSCENISPDKVQGLFEYLTRELEVFPEIKLVDYNENQIKFKYKKETVHTIKFDFKKGEYTIAVKCSNIQYLKSGFQQSSSHMAKNAVRVNPIVHAHMEYVNSSIELKEK